jgi:hypothetical protein
MRISDSRRNLSVATLGSVWHPPVALANESLGGSSPILAATEILLPISFLLAVGMIFATVSSVLSADRAKARTARRLSILSAIVLSAAAAIALFVPGTRRYGGGTVIGLFGFAATVGLSTWLNLRRGWSFDALLVRIFVPGLLLSVAGALLSPAL